MEFENTKNPSARICDVCGERPAVAPVRFVAGGELRDGAVCEQCAREAMAAQSGGLP